MEEKPQEDVFIVDGCEHELCRICMSHHVESEVTQRHLPARCPCCPMEGEGKTELSENQAKLVLRPQMIASYDRISLAMGTVTCCRCNEPDCVGVVELVNHTHFICPIPTCRKERC